METVLSGNLVKKGGKKQVTGEGAGLEGGPPYQERLRIGGLEAESDAQAGVHQAHIMEVCSWAACYLILCFGRFRFPSCGNRIRC